MGLGALALFGAVALSGCVVFRVEPAAKQQHVIGSVLLTLKVCASESSNSPVPGACPNPGNSEADPDSEQYQLFLGFRVPKGTTAPRSFTATTGPGSGPPELKFIPSKSYRARLQKLDPAPVGQQWVGYWTSSYFDYSDTGGKQDFTAKVPFGLPTQKSGAPFKGPFRYRAVVGGRGSGSSTNNPQLAVDCRGILTEGGLSQHGVFVCVDSPTPTLVNRNAKLPTRDAGIVAGKRLTTTPGQKATAKFKFEYAGTKTSAAHFHFSARVTLKGASAKPSIKALTPPTDSTKLITVSVTVPRNAHRGKYTVELIAKLHGQTRTGTVTLTVR